MRNQEVSRIFREIAKILELKGEIIFRIRAYERAAQAIDNLEEDIESIAEAGGLCEIPAIGVDLAQKIKEIVETGKLKYYEKLKEQIAPGLIEMMAIPGLGPKTVKKLYEELKIDSVEKLEKAAASGKLKELKGIREKTEENILRGIEIIRKSAERKPINFTINVAKSFLARLKAMKEVGAIEVAGSLRRRKDIVRDIDILITSDNSNAVMKEFVNLDLVKDVLSHGETKSSVIAKENNMQVDLRVVERESFGFALLYFTGSKEFNIRLRQLAIKNGCKLNEYGLFSAAGKKIRKLAASSEEEIFSLLKMDYIPPELREDRGEIAAALAGKLPKLITLRDIKGDFHVHSKYSDGLSSIEEIAARIEKYKYEYAAICDHSQGLKVAGGLCEAQVHKKLKEITRVNDKSKVKLLSGTEVDITSEGSLDYPQTILKEFDVVVAAIHTGFKQTRQQLTKRIVNACKNKYVNIIAHPTGRLWGSREAYDVDINEISRAAKDNQVALEINCYPQRLDLNDVNVMHAKKIGAKFALGTDTHQLDQLQSMELGVAVSRRGWLTKADIINCLSLDKIMEWLRK